MRKQREKQIQTRGSQIFTFCLLALACAFFLAGCNELKTPQSEPFYAEKVEPPPKKEFRWSNGRMPKSFDPALAAASPEADFARALYEGLTDIDSKTLQAVPAVAAKWTNSEDFKTWTFNLRRDAKWSNGASVTARDFVASWKRLVELGDRVPQRALFQNIVGMDTENVVPVFANEEIDVPSKNNPPNAFLGGKEQSNSNTNSNTSKNQKTAKKAREKTIPVSDEKDIFGVEAVNDYTLKVTLVNADKDFPSLVAHPIFRPVYGDGREFETNNLNANLITNGAFRVASIEAQGIALDRADSYWNRADVDLETVKFVPTDSAENALAAYRAGEIDAVTNADFKPLALKLLEPYNDFRRTTHSALNFYQFNESKPQFKDARVRKALAMAIERERLTRDEMDGASHPAFGFSPFSEEEKISQNAEDAQKLLAEAGFPGGAGFPKISLLINRNDTQRRIARVVKEMWQKTLNIETEIVIKDQAEFESAFQNGEYDLIRRGVVLPTTDEAANLLTMFPPVPAANQVKADESTDSVSANTQILNDKIAESKLDFGDNENKNNAVAEIRQSDGAVLTEKQALERLPAIPLYFPTSYSLVKPYVSGFETNALDAPSLKDVKIDHDWQPAKGKFLSKEQR